MNFKSTVHALSLVAGIAALSSLGCMAESGDGAEPLAAGDILEGQGVQLQGVQLQGPVLQGPVLQGVQLQGPVLQGINFNGVSFQGVTSAQSVVLVGGELVAVNSTGSQPVSGALIGATFSAALSNGSTLSVRIDDITPTAEADIFEYTVVYHDGTGYVNLCGYENGAPVKALALSGAWDMTSGTPTGGSHIDDPSMFTFACKNAVLAKCVIMGYAPWREMVECFRGSCSEVSMRHSHQACTRMMRADYCGDGMPHTQNGTTINVWDNLNLQTKDTQLPVTWTNEAEWGSSGALCIEQVRWQGQQAESYIDHHCSNRWNASNFDCFTNNSTFFSAVGLSMSYGSRSLIRNQFTHDPY